MLDKLIKSFLAGRISCRTSGNSLNRVRFFSTGGRTRKRYKIVLCVSVDRYSAIL